MNNRFSKHAYIILFCIYGDRQLWNHSSVKSVTNNVTVLAARFASQLHFNNVGEEFLNSYRRASALYRRDVVMEILASMVLVAMGDFGTSLRHMENAKRLSHSDDPRKSFYRTESQELNDIWALEDFLNN